MALDCARTLGALIVLPLVFAGCARFEAPIKPPMGIGGTNAFLLTHVKAPLTVDFDNTPAGAAAKKVSHAETKFITDFLFTLQGISVDDASIQKIAREGGITKIAFADYEAFMVLGLFGTFTVNVYGS